MHRGARTDDRMRFGPWGRVASIGALVAATTVAAATGRPAEPAATPPAAVVELFTSQGCSKCPPADRLIGELAARPRTIALSFAVATWDYIGWKDTLAEPAFSTRQRAYAAVRGDRLVYTPQAIVDGVGVERGSDREAILRDIETLPNRSGAMTVPLTLTETNGRLLISIGPKPAAGAPASADVLVLRVARKKTIEIDRGENSGREVTYTNVVRGMNRVGTWTGAAEQFEILELKGDGEGYVVLVQGGSPERPGVVLAAGKTADL